MFEIAGNAEIDVVRGTYKKSPNVDHEHICFNGNWSEFCYGARLRSGSLMIAKLGINKGLLSLDVTKIR